MDIAAIWNMALADIGSTATVTGAGDLSKAGVQCGLWWPVARDGVLRAFPWPFATVTATLAQIPAATYQAPDWGYAYGYPDDCLKALELLSPAGRNPPSRARIPWAVRASVSSGGGTVRYVVTDYPPGIALGEAGDGYWPWGPPVGLQPLTMLPCLRYVAQVTDVSVYPPEVCVAMAWQLAAYLAMPLAMAKELRVNAEQEARVAVASAIAVSLNERQGEVPRDADAQMARR